MSHREERRSSYGSKDIQRKKYMFKEGDWECSNSRCKNQNFAKRTQCNLCGEPKGRSRSGSVKRRTERRRSRSRSNSKCRGDFKYKEGDWKCDSCKNVNFAWRTKCNICRKEKKNDSHSRSRSRSRSRNNSRDRRKERSSKRRRSSSFDELFSSRSGSRDHKKHRNRRDRKRSISPSLSPVMNKDKNYINSENDNHH